MTCFPIQYIEQILQSVLPGPSCDKIHEVIGTHLLWITQVRDYVT